MLLSETSDFLRYSAKSIWVMWCSPLICLLFKYKHNIFCFFFISMLQTTNLFFAFKNNNCCYLCRVCHDYTIELFDWLIWLVYQFWLFHLNKHPLVEILLTTCNYYHLWCKYPQGMFKNVPHVQNKMLQ